MTTYTLWTNLDSSFRRSYEAGDRVVRGFVGHVDLEDVADEQIMCEEIWQRHNRDNRPDGKSAPSLSVGDVIELPHAAYSVSGMGFTAVQMTEDGRITDRTWAECLERS
jgi:hypothetical protein